MLKKSDIQPSASGSEEVEYYKSLARLAERRARDIRRIAALERQQLEARAAVEKEASSIPNAAEGARLKAAHARLQNDLKMTKRELAALRKIHESLTDSRAHGLAAAYIELAAGDTFFAKVLRPVRILAHLLFPVKERVGGL
jgi:hypothetical protein